MAGCFQWSPVIFVRRDNGDQIRVGPLIFFSGLVCFLVRTLIGLPIRYYIGGSR